MNELKKARITITGFLSSELETPQSKWESIVADKQQYLDSETQKWLESWNLYDYAWSPMDDVRRRVLRTGHYIGWIDHENYAFYNQKEKDHARGL